MTVPLDGPNPETIHVLAADPALDDPAAAAALLGGEADPARIELIHSEALAGVGLSGYLVDGQGASADAVLPDEARLDALTRPVLLILPGAIGAGVTLSPDPVLRHVGSYRLEGAAPAGAPLRSPSAEGLAPGAPPVEDRARADRRASGYVAMAALAVALLVVLVMVLVAG